MNAAKAIHQLTSTTIVRALRSRETTLRPTVGLIIVVEKSVFLFKTKPRLRILGFVKNLLGVMAVISPVRSAIVVIGLC